jgi:hypothetical protein
MTGVTLNQLRPQAARASDDKGLEGLLCIVVDIWAAIDGDKSLPLVGQSVERLHSVDFKWISNRKSLELKRFVNREGTPSLHNQVSCSERS